MAKRNTDPDEMFRFVKAWKEFREKSLIIASDLQNDVDTARGTLKDKYIEKSLKKIEELCTTLKSCTYEGDEMVRELERSAKVLKELEELER